MLRFFRRPALSDSASLRIQKDAESRLGIKVGDLLTEWCFYIQTITDLSEQELSILQWLLAETFEKCNFSADSFLPAGCAQLEVGPRLNFETAWSSTAVSICRACGVGKVIRLERSLRIGLSEKLDELQAEAFLAGIHDRMTQMQYPKPLQSFDSGLVPESVKIIPVMENGIDALREINKRIGLSMDEQDLQIWFNLFANDLRRNPTDAEVFQCGAPNSEHCRHGFFKGGLGIDGVQMPESLMQIVKTPWLKNPGDSLIAFCDDSSAIQGTKILKLLPLNPGQCGNFATRSVTYHPTLTAETHNFPSGVAPFPGAETGTGGRIRDNQCVGRGGLVVAGGAAYCVDNLHIPGYVLPWEDDWKHPAELASPLDILIGASNGASDYGNKFGEPVIYGFTRSFGQELPDGRRGWFKPIMYTVGAGQIDDRHISKGKPEKGMLLVRLGGPDYRIGMGGGPASSMIQGENVAKLDLDAVQRGDAQMEQRMNRVIRAAIEMGDKNPFVSAHDLGAVGNCNAFSELADPAGAKIKIRSFPLGDRSLSVLEIWGNESQERDAFLVWPESFDEIKAIADREGVPCVIVGQITGDGWLILHDDNDGTDPVRLPLDKVLGAIPLKTFELKRIPPQRKPLEIPKDLTVRSALDLVLRLISVGSKRFLTTKVDRSVTGLVAQQQCVGPNQLTLSDYAAIAQSLFGLTGVALSLGEQPIIGLLSPQAMSRMAVAEALLNMVGAKITAIRRIRCEANWMVAAKLPGEGAWLYDAACALRDILVKLGPAIDGGKDSLSMAAKTIAPDGSVQIVKTPGQLVIANYALMPDITCKVTPDLKHSGSSLVFIDLASGKNRLGGSALAQVLGQVGNECPDIEDTELLARAFETVQDFVKTGLISAVHDRCHHGGLITTILEMAFAGNKGVEIHLPFTGNVFNILFGEEAGLVVECRDAETVLRILEGKEIPAYLIGRTSAFHQDDLDVVISCRGTLVLQEKLLTLRDIWEETSSKIDALQANPQCVDEERRVNATLVKEPPYRLSFAPYANFRLQQLETLKDKPKVAVVRAEGSNGDREMTSAFYLAGFDPWDITMSDLTTGKIGLDTFRGIADVGGFASADVFDAGKAWAGIIRFNERAADQFRNFYARSDTFSLGVCNGCQLMALLGQIPWPDLPDEQQPRFIHNLSERFEQRYPAVRIFPSPAIMLKGMEGSILPILTAHGEGRCFFPDEKILRKVLDTGLAPIRFVDNKGIPTEQYPFNPNGSVVGITALCSPDGRHLAMMPHPERCFLRWQMEAFYWPQGWNTKVSPWLQLFQNAYEWCMQ